MKKSIAISIKKNKRAYILGFPVAIALLLTIILILSFRSVSHADSVPYEFNYKSVQIEDGDTLTTIAREYLPSENISHAEFIEIICDLNHISTDDVIYSGVYLVIPVLAE